MSSSPGTSNLRYRKTVRSTSSNNVLGSSPGAGFLGGHPLPPCRSNKINDNENETQFSVRSSIPHETRNTPRLHHPQLHDSKQIELTSVRRFQPSLQPFPKDLNFPPGSSQIATKKSFQPPNSEPLNYQYQPLKSSVFSFIRRLKSSVFSFISRLFAKAPSPPKSSVASTSSNPPIASSLTKGDGSKAFACQPGTSEMHGSNVYDCKRLVRLFEYGAMRLKEIQAVDDANLELQKRKDDFLRRYKKFSDSRESESPEKVRETYAMFIKEREDMEQCMSELEEKIKLLRSRPLDYQNWT